MSSISQTVSADRYTTIARRAAGIVLIVYLYPAAGGLLGGSGVPVYFGRYSSALAAFNLFTISLVLAFAVAWRRNGLRLFQLCLWGVILGTFVVPGNDILRSLPFMIPLMPGLRLMAALAIVLVEFCHVRRTGREPAKAVVALASVAATLAVFDLLCLPFSGRPMAKIRNDVFEDAMHANAHPPRFIVIGDSCAYGNGVGTEQSFPILLDHKLSGPTSSGTVLRLAIPGIGFIGYNRLIQSVPEDTRVERVVVSFHWNDLPPIERFDDLLQRQALALGRGAPSLRLLADTAAIAATPTCAGYHQRIIENVLSDWQRARRWQLLRNGMEKFHAAAAIRSRDRPLLMIIPLMVDYHDYPLDGAHEELTKLAAELDFEVLDLLPIFRRELGDGDKFRAAPNDNHFDASVHRLVAQVLFDRLEQSTGASR
jgi:hypothetical protein